MSEHERLREAMAEMQRSSSRVMAIVYGAYLDDGLKELLRGFLVADDRIADALFNELGPLGTFAARIDSAYLLGLISPEDRQQLHIIRRIRNRFAHAADRTLSFDTADIRDRCGALQYPAAMPELIGVRPEDVGRPERRFLCAATYLNISLAYRLDHLQGRRVRSPSVAEEVVALWRRAVAREAAGEQD